MPGGYNLGTASGRIVIDGSGAKAGFDVARGAAEGFVGVIQGRLQGLREFGDNMARIGTVGGAGLGIAVAAAASFEQRLSAVQAVSGATADEFDKLSEAALRIGADTSFSATEAASAMEELVKAGISVDDVLNGAADATVALAAAGEISLPRAAEIASAAMNNFNLVGSDLPRVADLIAGAANASAIDVGEFGISLQQVGAVANLTGLSFQDTAVAIAEMGNAGIKGSDAGTSLKTMLLNLIPVTDRQKTRMEELGLLTFDTAEAMVKLREQGIVPASESMDDISGAIAQYIQDMGGAERGTDANAEATQDYIKDLDVMNNAFFDAEGNIRPFAEIQGVLADATKDLTKEQQLSTLETLFGADAIRAAAVAAGEGAQGYADMYAAMSQTTAAEVAATRMNNLKGSVERLKGSFETALITIGNVFLPIVRRVVEAINSAVDTFNNLPEPVKRALAIIVGVGAAIAALIGAVISLSFVLVPLIAHFVAMLFIRQIFSIFAAGFTALRAGSGVMAAVGATAGRAATVFSRFGRIGQFLFSAISKLRIAFLFLTGPIGIAIGVVLALVAAGKILYDNFEPFRELVNRIAGSIRDFFLPAFQEAKAGFDALIASFKSGDSTSSGFIGVMERIGVGVRTAWEAIKDLGTAFMENVVPALRAAGAEIAANFGPAIDSIVEAWNTSLKPALQDLWTAIQTNVIPAIVSIAEALWPIIRVIGIVVGVIVGVLLVALYKVALFIISEVLPVLIQFAAFLIGKLITVIAAVATFIIKYLVTPLVRFVTFLITDVFPAILRFEMMVRDKLIAAFFAVKDAVVTGANAVKDFALAVAAGFVAAYNAVKSFVLGVIAAISGFIGQVVAVVQRIVAPLVGPFNAVKDLVIAIFSLLFTIVRVIFEIAFAIIEGVVVNFARGVVVIFNFLKDNAVEIFTAIKDFVQGVWSAIANVVVTAAIFLRDKTIEIFTAVKSFLATVWEVIKTVIIEPIKQIVTQAVAKFNEMRDAVRNKFNEIRDTLSSTAESMRSTVASKFEQIRSAIVTPIDNATQGVRDKIGEMVGVVGGVGGRVISAIGDMAGLLYNKGRDIISGLINGITSRLGALRDSISNVGATVTSGIRSALRISSPSRVTREYGRFIVQGLNIGMEQERAAAGIVAGSVADTIIASMKPLDNLSYALDAAANSAVIRRLPSASPPAATEMGATDGAPMIGVQNVYYPVAEPASQTTVRTATRAAQLGRIGR